MGNEEGYVKLVLFCAEICETLDRGTRGKKEEDLTTSLCQAMDRLTT